MPASRSRKDSRRAGVNERARKTLRVPFIHHTETDEMVKRGRAAGQKARAAK